MTGAPSVLAGVALALMPLAASAATFIRIGGPGASDVQSRRGWIEINRISFGDADGHDMATASNSARLAWQFSSNETLVVYGPPATVGARLRAAAGSGRRIPQVVIEVTGGEAVSERYRLEGVKIVRDEVSGAPPAQESLALTFFSMLHTTPAASRGGR
jgi:hypothetical protein